MKAAVYERRGPAAQVLEMRSVPDPQPGPGEVRVRVHASGVNPTDCKSRAAGPELPWEWQVPGQDGAGVVDAVGDGVPAARVGERVWVFHAAWQRRWGTSAEMTCVPTEQAVTLPDGVTFTQGAGLGIPYVTAHGCLFGGGPLRDRTVLVHGGAGAVGHAAIELAVRDGARVVTTVSSAAKARLAEAAGAHVVVDYTEPGAADRIRAAAPDGVDRILEVALHANLDLDLHVLAPHGTVVCYAADGPDPVVPVRRLMTGNVHLDFALVYTFTPEQVAAAVAGVDAALRAGALSPLPELVYPLDEVVAAHEAVEGHAVGKVLLVPPGA